MLSRNFWPIVNITDANRVVNDWSVSPFVVSDRTISCLAIFAAAPYRVHEQGEADTERDLMPPEVVRDGADVAVKDHDAAQPVGDTYRAPPVVCHQGAWSQPTHRLDLTVGDRAEDTRSCECHRAG